MIITKTNKQTGKKKQTNKRSKKQTAETGYATTKLVCLWF